MGKLTEMLSEAFSSTPLNESITPINTLAASELLAVVKKLDILYKDIKKLNIPGCDKAAKYIDSYVDSRGGHDMYYFCNYAESWINNLTNTADRVNALHIWFTEAVPVLKKQLSEYVFEQIGDVYTVDYDNKQNMRIVYKNRELLNAFKNGRLKNFKAKKHSYTFIDDANTLVVNTNIHSLYERVTMMV